MSKFIAVGDTYIRKDTIVSFTPQKTYMLESDKDKYMYEIFVKCVVDGYEINYHIILGSKGEYHLVIESLLEVE